MSTWRKKLKNRAEILGKLAAAVIGMDEEGARSAAQEAIDNGINAAVAINEGLVKGMEVVGEKYEQQEYFIPEVVLCSDAMIAGIGILRKHLSKDDTGQAAKVVIGVVQGDTHDIGKNLVKIMLETSGFEVFDLGRDVPPRVFVDKAKAMGAEIIALSTLMTTTMDGMKEVMRLLDQENVRGHFKVMVGGEPISQAFADKIGADGYAATASGAVKVAKSLIGGRQQCLKM